MSDDNEEERIRAVERRLGLPKRSSPFDGQCRQPGSSAENANATPKELVAEMNAARSRPATTLSFEQLLEAALAAHNDALHDREVLVKRVQAFEDGMTLADKNRVDALHKLDVVRESHCQQMHVEIDKRDKLIEEMEQLRQSAGIAEASFATAERQRLSAMQAYEAATNERHDLQNKLALAESGRDNMQHRARQDSLAYEAAAKERDEAIKLIGFWKSQTEDARSVMENLRNELNDTKKLLNYERSRGDTLQSREGASAKAAFTLFLTSCLLGLAVIILLFHQR